MNTLEKIVAYKKEELIIRKMMVPVDELMRSAFINRKCLSLKNRLLDNRSTGIIAEFKRKSPSKGIINDLADVGIVTGGYTRLGAAGLSVLTDHHFLMAALKILSGQGITRFPSFVKTLSLTVTRYLLRRQWGQMLSCS